MSEENIADLFMPPAKDAKTRPARGSGLGDILPPRQRSAAVAKPAQKPSSPRTSVIEPVILPEPKTARKTSQKADMGPQNRAVYIPHEVKNVLRQKRIAEQSTYTDILIDAFDEVSDEKIQAELNPEPTKGNRMPRRRRTNTGDKAGTQIQLRLDANQDAWLAERGEKLGAKSRSELVTVVYELYLRLR